MSCTRRRSFATLTLLLAMVAASHAQTFNTIFSFDGTDGGYPYYVYLVQGVNGQLYGTTYGGGANSQGTAFEITTDGTINTLYNFCSLPSCTDGAAPAAGLLLASDGNFYGTTTAGGTNGVGTVFKMTPAGVVTTLYGFCTQSGCRDGGTPYVGLIQGSNGLLYGTASGDAAGCGTIFSITTAGKFTLLHTFNCSSDGAYPDSRLVQGANGAFYGVTYSASTVYEISAAGKFTVLHTFSGSDGTGPTGALFLASNGNFYGTTSAGGTNSAGTIYEMTPAGKLTTLYNFCSLPSCADGSTPWAGLIQANDGNLYGATSQGGGPNNVGTVFKLTLAGTLTTLYTFCQSTCMDGASPYEGLMEHTNGILYGTTHAGGPFDLGTVYSEAVTDLKPFVAALPGVAKVKAKVAILGTNLTGATAVSFNGTPATFTVATGGASISTTVPAGATTGILKVTTPSGTLATTAAFKVTPQIKGFSPPTGSVGTPVTITGVSLTQTKTVTFGGVRATSFTVNSDTQVTATVPTGAKTGKIVITTSGGTASSTTSFTVT